MAADPGDNRDALEAFHTARRLTELRLRPVQGAFDVEHLKEINRRIFQDLPGLGFTDVTPGEFRSPAPDGRDWVKHRTLDTARVTSHVAYSPMDEANQSRMAKRLGQIDLAVLNALTTDAFTRNLADLYADLDYIHPFRDGNSRTLREFTRQLADAAGFDLRWEVFGQAKGGRDVLYVARDLSVNRQALPLLQHEDTRRDITFTLDQLAGNRDLPELLLSAGRAVVRPHRAIGFERLSEHDACAKYPELAPLYRQMDDAASKAQTAFAQSPGGQTRFLAQVRARIQTALDAGEVSVARASKRENKPHDRPAQSDEPTLSQE